MSREIDALVAEHIFDDPKPLPGDAGILIPYEARLPHYSTRIEDAWKVVEKLLPHFRIEYYENDESHTDYTDNPGWHADFWLDSGHGCAEGYDTAPMAICVAALKAVGVELEENE